jgi:light-regulated signal transduction histidine kinase (bacteriophytochrome)
MKESVLINTDIDNLQKELAEKNAIIDLLQEQLSALTTESNQFTYIVSHDLQAPLRMVTGFLELLEKKHAEQLNESARQYIGFAVNGASKMKRLIFDLLEYSRLTTQAKEHVEVDLNEAVKNALEKLATVITDSSVKINIESLPVVKAEAQQMTELFYQLLSNAIKFRKTDAPEINLSLKNENDYWLITISDNGVGFDPAFSEKIFTIFRRLYADETKYEGTGAGLAKCKRIAELHGGTIGASSVLNEGSNFYFTIPVYE